jgi:DNA (cytosine-5)-methyltransferase 1
MQGKLLRHGSLFSGIGGFDLAAQWMGWENVFHCEWNTFGQKVLNYYWPKAKSYNDITKTDFTIHRGTIDILTGGFPCQPFSVAGKQKGTEDERHLWPEMLRAIREIQPPFVLGENVSGLISWNDGLVFEQVQIDLETEGYSVTPFLLPACSVNAPHKRERIWFIAYKNTNRNGWRSKQREEESRFRKQRDLGTRNNERVCAHYGEFRASFNANHPRNCTGLGKIQKTDGEVSKRDNDAKPCNTSPWTFTNSNKINGRAESQRRGEAEGTRRQLERRNWNKFPTESPICDGDDGLSGRLDGITVSKWISESLKAGGNAIVPQVALQIFKAIEQFNNLTHAR